MARSERCVGGDGGRTAPADAAPAAILRTK
jgi:hypothetical protein